MCSFKSIFFFFSYASAIGANHISKTLRTLRFYTNIRVDLLCRSCPNVNTTENGVLSLGYSGNKALWAAHATLCFMSFYLRQNEYVPLNATSTRSLVQPRPYITIQPDQVEVTNSERVILNYQQATSEQRFTFYNRQVSAYKLNKAKPISSSKTEIEFRAFVRP